MSISGSLLTHENIAKKLKKRTSDTYSSKFDSSHLRHKSHSMEDNDSSLNSTAINQNCRISANQDLAQPYIKGPHMQTAYINTKRKPSQNNSIYTNNNNYLHLNSLWSIWYGVLLTLYQGYLAIHGASRFLSCSMLPWKVEPVSELNLQIIMSGLVFVLLPFFFTSAVFKVGNMANDGIKLASSSKRGLCSKVKHNSLEEESRAGSLRTLWIHGGPTAAFMHIIIAMCLLLPRLLLEGRIIENGLLTRETIWQTELDFMAVNRKYLVVLSLRESLGKNNTLFESQEDDINFNDTAFFVQSNNDNSSNLFASSVDNKINYKVEANKKNKYIKFLDLADFTQNVSIKESPTYENINENATSPTSTSTNNIEKERGNTTPRTNEPNVKMYSNEEIAALASSKPPPNLKKSFEEENKYTSSRSQNNSDNSYHIRQLSGQNNQKSKILRKHNKQRKSHQQFHSYQKFNRLKNQNNLKFDLPNLPNFDKTQRYSDNKIYGLLNHSQLRITTISTTARDSDIHIVKPERLPEITLSTPLSSTNSKIIEIKQKPKTQIKRAISTKKDNLVNIEPELFLNDSSEYVAEIDLVASSVSSTVEPTSSDYTVHLDGFAGMLQLLLGVEKPIDLKTFHNPPSAEFINLLFALLVWCVRYPAVFWTTGKSFATLFSMQMIASAADIIFSYVGISSLYKLQTFSQGQEVQSQGLILNASVTLALYLLSVVLILSSSMVLYLFGHGRLLTMIRNRSIISLSSNKSWIYFTHCASFCYILALCVVKAPLLNDLNATYRNTLHSPTFLAVLVSVFHIFLWIMVWMVLTVKRKWSFKLPPLDACTVVGKATTQPLLMHKRENLTKTTTGRIRKSSTPGYESSELKLKSKNSGNLLNNTSCSDELNNALNEDIYWPKTTSSSPKMKVTFNEVTSNSDDDHHLTDINEHEQISGKRKSSREGSVYFTCFEGEIDDGEYATLKAGPTTDVGNTQRGGLETKSLKEYDELPTLLLAPIMQSSLSILNHTIAVSVNPRNTYVNFFNDAKVLGDNNLSDEGKLLEHVLDESVTYVSTNDLEPPLPPPPPTLKQGFADNNASVMYEEKCSQLIERNELSASPGCFINPLAPVTETVQTTEGHISQSFPPRCSRNFGSEVAHDALTPRSDTNSFATECTISPPERAPSESSSGVHSAEEREIDVLIRPRIVHKHSSKIPQPAIQEEPNGRCTNMRMSSFAGVGVLNSATLPPPRTNVHEKFDYSQHCSTMPLPMNNHNLDHQETQTAIYATSAQCISKTQSTFSNVSSFKTPVYVNSGFAVTKQRMQDQNLHSQTTVAPQRHLTHTILSNGVRYSNPNVLKRHALLKIVDSQTFVASFNVQEDGDSANFSMISDQDSLYATANSLY